MCLSNLNSTPSKLLDYHTYTVDRLAWLATRLGIGKGFIERIGKLENTYAEKTKITKTYGGGEFVPGCGYVGFIMPCYSALYTMKNE